MQPLQFVADELDIDLLHIKGAAADPTLRPSRYAGTDVDVLVRPSQFAPLDAALRHHGWRLYSTFAYGSPFGHAQTYTHDAWGYVDVHRFFPGIRLAPSRRSIECGAIVARPRSQRSDAPCRASPRSRCCSS